MSSDGPHYYLQTTARTTYWACCDCDAGAKMVNEVFQWSQEHEVWCCNANDANAIPERARYLLKFTILCDHVYLDFKFITTII